LDLAGQILAGGKGSRLHRRLVREERLAQDVALFSMGLVAGASVTAGWATARPGVDLVRLEAAFWDELQRLGRETVSEDELERAKALTEADELGALQRVDEKADRLSMYATLFDDPEMINRILPRYLSTTAEQIRAVTAEVFAPDSRVVLTYLPSSGSEAPAEAA
ncbi:MAG: insulinase family protein, partial [Chloroflexi bacterium]|nr:insulinase family protein [Chloroflexota bacterium]